MYRFRPSAIWMLLLLVNPLAGPLTMAQEPLGRDEARKAALTIESLPMDWGTQYSNLKVDVLDAVGFKGSQGAGIIILPAQCLSPDKMKDTGTHPVTLGRIYMKDLTLGTQQEPVETGRLFQRTVSDGEAEVTVHAGILMAVRKTSGSWKLEVRGSGKQPLVTVPMIRIEKVTATPLEMDIIPADRGATITLNILGEFQAELPICRP